MCVCGDLQMPTMDKTYAATLAICVFQLMMVLVTAFDLEIEQFDVTNAFLNSDLPEKVYITIPPGFSSPGKC